MPAPADSSRLDQVNIGLMFLAAGAAVVFPCEVFLAAYVVLGPLHYLTQLSWLRDRRCYTAARFDWIWLALFALLNTLGARFDHFFRFDWRNVLIVLAFAVGGLVAFVPGRAARGAGVLGILACLWFFRHEPSLIGLALMLPTMLHVLVFTGAFLLTGALRRRNRWGLASFAVFAGLAAALSLAPLTSLTHAPSPRAVGMLRPFGTLLHEVVRHFGRRDAGASRVGVLRLIAFAYSYHYLNWFSKTRLLGWHTASRGRLTLIGVLYAGALALYGVSYELGYLVIGILGMVHVFLEFPLDWRTFVGLPGLLRQRVPVPLPAAPGQP